MSNNIDIQEIKDNVTDWTYDNIGPNFSFRKYQFEIICQIILYVLSDKETTIIEAPTGSGKSLIAIISAGVLSTYYNKSSYILCSDLYLWKQYAEFIQNKGLKNFGYLMGSKGNYTCFKNKQDFSCGVCRLAKISFKQLKNRDWRNRNMFTCVDKCVYMKQRWKAEKADVTLMTYQLYLHHMNLVKTDNPDFKHRDVIFCDECHNIPDIIQQFSAPSFHEERDVKRLHDILRYAADNNIVFDNITGIKKYLGTNYNTGNTDEQYINISEPICYTDVFDNRVIYKIIREIFDTLDDYKDDSKKVLDTLYKYLDVLKICTLISETLDDKIKKATLFNTEQLEDKKSLLNLANKLSYIDTYTESISNYIETIKNSGLEYLILEVNITDQETRNRDFLFNCAKEDYLCSEYLLKHAKNKIMLSATVGGQSAFDENIGTRYTKQSYSSMFSIPSTFDFSKSPILYSGQYCLNYSNKTTVYPIIQYLSYKIINSKPNQRGIIHTGSYENARMFYNNADKEMKKRLLLYGNPKQKAEIIEKFKDMSNGILVGPTLTEGIDLGDDYCRFIIILKVPYPNLTSKIVKKKLELFPHWYDSTTSNIIIQGIGRGVRNEHDYCQTFILDGNFCRLYNKTINQYPDFIKSRLQSIILN